MWLSEGHGAKEVVVGRALFVGDLSTVPASRILPRRRPPDTVTDRQEGLERHAADIPAADNVPLLELWAAASGVKIVGDGKLQFYIQLYSP